MAPSNKARLTVPGMHKYNLRSSLPRLRSGTRNDRGCSTNNNNVNSQSKRRIFHQRRRASVVQQQISRRVPGNHSVSSGNDNSILLNSTIKCAICLDTERSHKMEYIPCGHGFHAKCCEKWLSRNAACPVCRTPVTPPLLPQYFSHRSLSPRRRSVSARHRRQRHIRIHQRLHDMFMSSASILIIDVYHFRNPSRR